MCIKNDFSHYLTLKTKYNQAKMGYEIIYL